MITVDISNIWGSLSLSDLLSLEKEVSEAHMTLTGLAPYAPWQKLLGAASSQEFLRIQAAAQRICGASDVLVVVGIGGCCLGTRAAIELMQGISRNLGKGRGDPKILYAGTSLSSRHWNALCHLLEGQDYSVVIVSKHGDDMESAVAARTLRWMLERKYGTDEARNRIYVVTDPFKSNLRLLAQAEGWDTFPFPQGVDGQFAVLSPVGLLPMAVAGIDIRRVLAGAAEAAKRFDLRSFENPVWLYTAVRNLLLRKGKAIELLEYFDPGAGAFGLWWQQLFGETEGKDGSGLFPVPIELPGSLYALGQTIQQGQRNLFETMLRFAPPLHRYTVSADVNDLTQLNYLSGMTLAEIEEQAVSAAVGTHTDSGVPVITIDGGDLTEETLGELLYFFQLSAALSAAVLGVSPFDRPGVAQYRQALSRTLGKPDGENPSGF